LEIIGTDITERHIKVPKEKKISALIEIIEEATTGKVLVFVATKRSTEFLARQLNKRKFFAGSINGNKSQRARENALKDFKIGKTKILIATDIAARGLQIDNIEFVVNYDLPNDANTYKHRVGRTGRMGKTGVAITFVGENGNIIGRPNQSFNRKSNRGGGPRSKHFSHNDQTSNRFRRKPKHNRKIKNKFRSFN